MTYMNCRSVTMLFLRRFGSRNFSCFQIVKGCEEVKSFKNYTHQNLTKNRSPWLESKNQTSWFRYMRLKYSILADRSGNLYSLHLQCTNLHKGLLESLHRTNRWDRQWKIFQKLAGNWVQLLNLALKHGFQ